jgi:hypothetical protein
MAHRSKYGAKKITIDGETFDSLGEAKWFQSLKLIQRAGSIHGLTRQVPLQLHGADGSVVATLILDAVWQEGDLFVYADFKGMETAVSRLKRKLFLAEYGPIRLFGARGEIPLTKTGRRKRASTKPRERIAA